jgi:hypothetical protein
MEQWWESSSRYKYDSKNKILHSEDSSLQKENCENSNSRIDSVVTYFIKWGSES